MISKELEATLSLALNEAKRRRHEYVCIEHLLFALLQDKDGGVAIVNCGGDLARLKKGLEDFFQTQLETVPEGSTGEPQQTIGFHRVIQRAVIHAQSAEKKEIISGLFHRALQRILVLLCQTLDQGHLGFGKLVSIDSGYPNPLFMDMEHDLDSLCVFSMKNVLQDLHYEFLSCVIVIVQQNFIERRFFDLFFGLGDHPMVKFCLLLTHELPPEDDPWGEFNILALSPQSNRIDQGV